MDNMTMLIVMAVLIVFSAFFSATETAFSSINKIRMINLSEKGNKNAKKVLKLSQKFDAVLSTILVGNNIVNIMLTAIATVLFTGIFGQESGAVISTVIITVVVLVFGEISPKSLAKESPEHFAMSTVNILSFFIVLFKPVNYLFGAWKRLLSKIFKSREKRVTTEEELLTIVGEAEHEGGIDSQESELLRSAIEFNELDVSDILTPRVDITAVTKDMKDNEISEVFYETGFSRLPVYGDSLDDIIGVIHMKDFYSRIFSENKPIDSIIKDVMFVSPTTKIDDLLKQMQKKKHHMAVIADEYGGTVGIVTMEDILEKLVGEIWDEHDEIIEEIQKIGENVYKISCGCDFETFNKDFSVSGESEASTVGGWVMEKLGKIPQIGDNFVSDGLDVTVTKTEEKRVVEIKVKLLKKL